MWQPNKLEQERLDKLRELEAAGLAAYPARVERTHTNAQAIAALEAYEAEHPGVSAADGTDIQVTVTGRIRRVNIKGKLSFLWTDMSDRKRHDFDNTIIYDGRSKSQYQRCV